MPDVHSKIAPSSLERTILCPPSLRLNEQYPKEDTKYTVEGTIAHSVCEYALYSKFNLDKSQAPDKKKVIEGVTGEMISYAMDYSNFIDGRVRRIVDQTDCLPSDVSVYPELQVHMEKYIPLCFGTSDCVIMSPSRIAVVDFKYGVNKVPATGSPLIAQKFGYSANVQLSAYALGAFHKLPDYRQNEIDLIEIYIYQPRATGGEYFAGMGIKPKTLISFADVAKEKVQLALDGKGDLCAGSHCRFCKHKNKCTEYIAWACANNPYAN